MSINIKRKINYLLSIKPRDGLLFAQWLESKGFSRSLQQRYRSSGWLESLCRGVMYRTNENLSAFGALESFNYQLHKQCRVAAHSALELWGFNHYIPMGKPILMVSISKERQPQWMKYNVFDREFKFFNTEVFPKAEVSSLHYLNWELLVSSPEQAFMECLLLSPRQYSYMDLFYIMEQLTTLRPNIVQTLLESSKHYKMKRLFLYMAEKAGHYWFEELDLSKIDIGTHKLQLVKSGIYINKYRITIPKELNDYE